MVATQTLSDFCTALSERTPTPGGGAAAAVLGAVGAAQLCMIAEYSTWPKETDNPSTQLRGAIAELLRLAQEDADAYAAYRENKNDPVAKERVVTVPKQMEAVCSEVLALTNTVATHAPRWFAPDLSIAQMALRACKEGATMLIQVNA